jgi:hypothetical protein
VLTRLRDYFLVTVSLQTCTFSRGNELEQAFSDGIYWAGGRGYVQNTANFLVGGVWWRGKLTSPGHPRSNTGKFNNSRAPTSIHRPLRRFQVVRFAKKISTISHYGLSGGHFVFGSAAVTLVLPLTSRSETRIRIKRAFRGLFGASMNLQG